MKNADQPCASFWRGDPCVDGDRCPTHADCRHCLDAGFTYRFEPGEFGKAVEAGANGVIDWDKFKTPCTCVAEKVSR